MTRTESMLGWLWLAFQTLLLSSLLLLLAAPLGAAWISFLYHLISAAAVSLIFHRFLQKALRTFRREWRRALGVIALSLAAHYLTQAALTALLDAVYPGFSNVNDNSIRLMGAQHPVLIALATVVLAPVSEEGLFRGLIFHSARRPGRLAAYAITVAAFAALHVMGYVGSYPAPRLLLCFLQYLPAGFLLTLAMDKTGSIVSPICIHAVINAVAMLGIVQ